MTKKPTLGSHSISVKYCFVLVYFRVTNNKIKAPLTILRNLPTHMNFESILYSFPDQELNSSLNSSNNSFSAMINISKLLVNWQVWSS